MAVFRGILAGTVLFFLFLTVTESLPPVWDEGDSAARADSVLYWVTHIVPGTTDISPWSEETLRKYIPNTVSLEGHPAGYIFLIAAGKGFCDTTRLSEILSEKVSYRFGPILLSSIALGIVFYRLETGFSLCAALFGTSSILLFPRIFTHIQIAFGDSVLISSWLILWGLFPLLRRNFSGAVIWGTVLGFTASAKFTGALAFFPFSTVILFFPRAERRSVLFRLFFPALPAALITFYLLNPPIWHSPLNGIAEYIRLNTHRSSYNIAILFLGKIYNLDHSLPWWNPFFWTLTTIPAGLLISGLAVLFRFLYGFFFQTRKESFFTRTEIILLILNWLTLILVRTIPGIPVHDGIRLFAPAFPFFAILAGLGLTELWSLRNLIFRTAVILILAGSASSLILYFPQELSYYNLLIGGLPGAVRHGMEATYYWDGLDRELTQFLKTADTEEESSRPILFSAASGGTLTRLRRQEEIPARLETISRLRDSQDAAEILTKTPFRYYILQNRGGGLTVQDRRLLRQGKPLFFKTAGLRSNGTFSPTRNPWNLRGVPLIIVYPYSEFLRVCMPAGQENR